MLQSRFTTFRDDNQGKFDFYVWGPIKEMKWLFGFTQEYPCGRGWVVRGYGADDRNRPAPGHEPWILEEREVAIREMIRVLIASGVSFVDNTPELIDELKAMVDPGVVAVHWNPLPTICELDLAEEPY